MTHMLAECDASPGRSGVSRRLHGVSVTSSGSTQDPGNTARWRASASSTTELASRSVTDARTSPWSGATSTAVFRSTYVGRIVPQVRTQDPRAHGARVQARLPKWRVETARGPHGHVFQDARQRARLCWRLARISTLVSAARAAIRAAGRCRNRRSSDTNLNKLHVFYRISHM